MAADSMKVFDRPCVRKFILDALNPDALPDIAAMQETDWACLLQSAQTHRLGPMLHDRLGHFVSIPIEVRDRLQAMHRKSVLRNLNIYRELVTVTRKLEAEQIPSIALKGAFLARFAYSDPGLRPMRDLDLLVRVDQAVKAFECLKACGYRPMSEGLPEAYLSDHHHLPGLISPDGINIELHHRLSAPGGHFPDFGEDIWARSISKMIGGTEVGFLCPEDLLLHLCTHAAIDHRLDLGPLALVDVVFLVETHRIDWRDFASRAQGKRCAFALLCLAKLHLGAKIPDEIIEAGLESDAAWLESAEYLLFFGRISQNLMGNNMQRILYPGNFMESLHIPFDIVFPPRSAISLHFPVRADSPQAFLYYPLNWLRLFTEKLPFLLEALSDRKRARKWALHRKTFSDWVQEKD